MKKYFFFMSLLVGLFVSTMSLTACSSDDDDDDAIGGAKGFVGIWTQSGDDDIFVLNSDGTWVTYEDEECYSKGIKAYFGNWKVNNSTFIFQGEGWIDDETGEIEYYNEEPEFYEIIDISDDRIILKNEWRTWTWVRYKK